MSGISRVYVLIMVAAVIAGIIAKKILNNPLPGRPIERFWLGFFGLAGAMVAAKVPLMVQMPGRLLDGSIFWTDGRTLTWGLVGGYFGVELAKWGVGIQEKTGDAWVVPLAISLTVGRLGCFYAGCCFGTETTLPWAHDFGDGVFRHPTQLYESIFHFLAAVTFYFLGKKNYFTNQRIKLYYLSYFVYRFVTEWIRPESKVMIGLTFYQISVACFFVFFCVLWVIDQKKIK